VVMRRATVGAHQDDPDPAILPLLENGPDATNEVVGWGGGIVYHGRLRGGDFRCYKLPTFCAFCALPIKLSRGDHPDRPQAKLSFA
jgi:hypothetical protein